LDVILHLSHLFWAEFAGIGHFDLGLLSGSLVDCVNVENSVGIHFKRDLDECLALLAASESTEFKFCYLV